MPPFICFGCFSVIKVEYFLRSVINYKEQSADLPLEEWLDFMVVF
jgi:hypothetical protein